jgi:GDP-D-mannose dehydratase
MESINLMHSSNSSLFGDIYRNKKVLVTGNTGFKGSWLTVWLLMLGAKVYGLSDVHQRSDGDFLFIMNQ